MINYSGAELFNELCPLDHPDPKFREARIKIDEILSGSFDAELFLSARQQRSAQPAEQEIDKTFRDDKAPVA